MEKLGKSRQGYEEINNSMSKFSLIWDIFIGNLNFKPLTILSTFAER